MLREWDYAPGGRFSSGGTLSWMVLVPFLPCVFRQNLDDSEWDYQML